MGSAEAVAAGYDDALADLEVGGQHLAGDRRHLGGAADTVGVNGAGAGDVGDRQPIADGRTGHCDGVIEVDRRGFVAGVAGVGDRRLQIVDRWSGLQHVARQLGRIVLAAITERAGRGQTAGDADGGAVTEELEGGRVRATAGLAVHVVDRRGQVVVQVESLNVPRGKGHLDAVGDRVAWGEHQGPGAEGLAVAGHHRLGRADIGHVQVHRAGVDDLAVGVKETAEELSLDVTLQADVIDEPVARLDVLTGGLGGDVGIVDAGGEGDGAPGGSCGGAEDSPALKDAVVTDRLQPATEIEAEVVLAINARTGEIREVADVGRIEGSRPVAGARDALLLEVDPGAARGISESIAEQILDDQIAEGEVIGDLEKEREADAAARHHLAGAGRLLDRQGPGGDCVAGGDVEVDAPTWGVAPACGCGGGIGVSDRPASGGVEGVGNVEIDLGGRFLRASGAGGRAAIVDDDLVGARGRGVAHRLLGEGAGQLQAGVDGQQVEIVGQGVAQHQVVQLCPIGDVGRQPPEAAEVGTCDRFRLRKVAALTEGERRGHHLSRHVRGADRWIRQRVVEGISAEGVAAAGPQLHGPQQRGGGCHRHR